MQPQFKTSSLLQSPSFTFLFRGGVLKGKKGAVAVAVSMVVTVGGGRRERTVVVFIAIATDIDIIIRAGASWGGGRVWDIIVVEIIAAIIAMATDIIDKVTVFAIGNIWFQGMDGGVQKGGKNRTTPSPSPLGEGARYQSLSSSRLQPSSIVSLCSRHLGGGRVGGRHCRRNTNGHKHCHGTQHHHQEYDRSRHHQHISVGDGGGEGRKKDAVAVAVGEGENSRCRHRECNRRQYSHDAVAIEERRRGGASSSKARRGRR